MADFTGMTLTNELVPREVLAPVDQDINQGDFKVRLKTGGTMRLDNSVWKIGDPDFQSNGLVFAALDLLELKNRSKIITNGNILILFVNTLKSEDGEIISFEETGKVAKAGANGISPGEAGMPGIHGDGGGLVSIHVIEKIEGIVHVNLIGQNGGKGGDGTSGNRGFIGSRGADSATAIGGFPPLPKCVRDATPGSKGGTGYPGGHGGDGGAGGSGGIFELYNIGDQPVSDASYTFEALAGEGGVAGIGGSGGPGGDGGPGGSGSLLCHGANGGPAGDHGLKGDDGNNGVSSSEGHILVKPLDIEILLRHIPQGSSTT